MRTVSYRIGDLGKAVIHIGHVAENECTRVQIDAGEVYAEYPSAAASLTVQPPEGEAFPAVVNRDGNLVVWDVKDSALTEDGLGEIQLTFTQDEVVVKSCIGQIRVHRSIVGSGEAPDPIEDFLAEAGAVLTAIPETIDAALQEAKDSGEFDGPAGPAGEDGAPGADGFSPVVSVSSIPGGHSVSVTDAGGTETFNVMDGVDGQDGSNGTDGYSPSASVTKSGATATIVITDKDGTTTAQISDGAGSDVIDDTAGTGDTTVTWSADKLTSEKSDVMSAIQQSPKVKNSTATEPDLDVSDENGNVILRLKDGHIQTKNFDSKNAGSDIVKNSSATGVDLDFSDESGNVVLRLKDGGIQTKYFNSRKLNPKIITVEANGSIRQAIEDAQEGGASDENPFVIQIAPGTYNILSEFTSDEIDASGFVGLVITDGITLEGMGIIRDEVVLTAELDTTDYDQTKRNNISTLNIKGNSGMKNITVTAKNLRYAVHDDMSFSSAKPKIRRCENCHFFATNTTSGGNGNISYGAGTDGKKVFLFKDCDFGDVVTIHTNTSVYSNLVIMENCRGFAFTATDYASSANNHYYLNNCVFNWIYEGKGSNWSAQHLFIHGNVKGAMVEGWDGMLYETGDTVQYLQYSALSAKKAVAMKNSGRYHLQLATGADDCIGIIYYYDSANNIAYVQHGGWICAELLGFASPMIGHYLNVGSDGTLSLDATDTSAIGKVICENATGNHFIKLSI